MQTEDLDDILEGWAVAIIHNQRYLYAGLVNIMRKIRDLQKEDNQTFSNPRIKNLKQDIRQLQRDLGHLRILDSDATWPPEYFERYNDIISTAKRLGVLHD
jgi:hypothetical protein